jgi:hypothetical protein
MQRLSPGGDGNPGGDWQWTGGVVNSATGEDFEREGIGYVAPAMKDSADKLYGSYHCHPI